MCMLIFQQIGEGEEVKLNLKNIITKAKIKSYVNYYCNNSYEMGIFKNLKKFFNLIQSGINE